jgi:hypothetical protein
MRSAGKSAPTEPTGVERLEPWMRRNPQYVAGIWTFFALAWAAMAVLSDDHGVPLALKLALPLGWALLAVREVRRYRTQQKSPTTPASR